jgi:transposase
MVVLGVDPHKKTHTVVAVDEQGVQLGARTVPATDEGHRAVLRWARTLPGQRRWAVEDCRHVAGRLMRDLTGAGEQVVRVPPRLTGTLRASARSRGKSDPIDALAVARACLREPGLPTGGLDEDALAVRLLVDRREQLVAWRTAEINRARWHLVELAPEVEQGAELTSLRGIERVRAAVAALPGSVRRQIALDQLAGITETTTAIRALEQQITARVTPLTPALLAIVGVGPLTAAKLLGEVGGIDRFTRSAQLAAHAGIACIPVWTGNRERHRLNRGGNRQINAAVHRVAVTQARMHPPAQQLLTRRRASNDTRKGALRVLKRHLIDVIFHAMKEDHARHQANPDHSLKPAAAA